MPYRSGLFLIKQPCAQCGEPIAAPLWLEHERNRVSFLWACTACNYQFVTMAVLKSEPIEFVVPQQPPVISDGPAAAA